MEKERIASGSGNKVSFAEFHHLVKIQLKNLEAMRYLSACMIQTLKIFPMPNVLSTK